MRIHSVAAAVLFLALATEVFAEEVEIDPGLVTALRQAVEDQHSFDDGIEGLMWLSEMSERLERRIPDPFYRVALLKTVHAESTRVDLSPELVLAVIQIESGFDRFAVSHTGARGLMQVMPFWKKEIGHPEDDLFFPPTNLRYGCAILRFYLDKYRGDLKPALARYNGSLGKSDEYPTKVLKALENNWQPVNGTPTQTRE